MITTSSNLRDYGEQNWNILKARCSEFTLSTCLWINSGDTFQDIALMFTVINLVEFWVGIHPTFWFIKTNKVLFGLHRKLVISLIIDQVIVFTIVTKKPIEIIPINCIIKEVSASLKTTAKVPPRFHRVSEQV